ncbi:ribonuclease HII [Fonticella tunisiensis]|uniref:Ribonuclease HII n=1 Tax=Fonticella tunisiensis TaxID=1096341 RepID=A0A4R7KSD7_9CLOT|nr:ribonuclease HII [Fonticella tunisiensis]TDT61594.1 RNase HII [Fonticella tunisiensis]
MKQYSIREIEHILSNSTYQEFIGLKEELIKDERRGVHNLVLKFENKFKMINKRLEEYRRRKMYEDRLLKEGVTYIAGVDEVGRGPLAGPVYAAAVILNPEVDIIEIKDSKKLSMNQRSEISKKIRESCLAYSVAYASVEEIDRFNILNATKLAMIRAIEGLRIRPEHILIDALRLEGLDIPQTSIIKGDDISISIGAASIIAKVERDNFMNEISQKYPNYYFEKNKGYGTPEHIDAIRRHGISDVHRKTFVKNIV